MKPGFVRVSEMLGGYSVEGVAYGPFQATAERPYLEVPESLANSLNLPRYEESDADAEAEADADPDDNLVEALRDMADRADSLQRQLDEDTATWEKQRASLLNDTSAALKREDAAKAELGDPGALVARLESLSDRLTPELLGRLGGLCQRLNVALPTLVDATDANTAAMREFSAPQNVTVQTGEPQQQADAPAAEGTPLPTDMVHREMLIANGFDTLEKLEAGLVLPEGAQESPVRALDGVGQKTEDAYRAAVADWRAQA